MTVAAATDAPPALKTRWDAIDWRAIHYEVRRLQVRIAKGIGTIPMGLQHPGRLSATFVSA